MTVAELLAQLSQKNVGLSVRGEELVVRGTEQVLETPGLIASLRENKKALVELIKAGRYVDPSGVVQVPPNLIPHACEAITPEMLPLVQLSAADIERIVSAASGGAANVQDIYPLAPLQEGILFHHLMATDGDPYLQNALCSFDTRGRLDGFLQALQSVIERHDILRTAVLWEGLPEPVQVVLRQAPLIVEEVHIDPAAGDVSEQLRARFDPRLHRLDIRQAPMMRVFVAHDSPNRRWVTLLRYHHLVDDGSSLGLMLAEIQAHMLGKAERLPAPSPFRNFVAQARLGVSRGEHEAFFRKMLGDVDEPTAPFGLTDVHGGGSAVKEARYEVDGSLAKRLREQARGLGVSAASLYHLAWALVVARLSGRDDVVFGTVLFGRMHGGDGADRGLGMFINTLPVRIRVGDDSAQEGIRQTHTLLRQLLRHEHAPLALAQRCSAVAAPAPLFTVLLNYRYGAGASEVQAEARHDWEGIEFLGAEERTNYPVSLNVDDLGEGFALSAQAQEPIDPDRICAYMRAALEQLVAAVEQAPTTPMRSLDALPASERRQMLAEWNATRADYPHDQLTHELFEAQAAGRPEAVAVAQEDDRLSYGELNVRANRLARHLRRLGVRPDTRVALCVERSLEMAVGLLAILKAGGAYVPLDPSYPVERLTYMLADSASAVVLTHAQAQTQIRSELARVGVPVIDLDADAARWEREPDANLTGASVGLTPDHLAYVVYTSGSTGAPKAVGNTISGLRNRLSWFIESALEEPPVTACKTSIGFVDSVTETLETLVAGGALVVFNSQTVRDTSLFARRIERFAVSNLTVVPSLLSHLLEIEPSAFRSLRTLICSGERLAPELACRVKSACPQVRLFNFYGSSEVNGDSTAFECARAMDAGSSIIGRPIANTRVYLLDNHFRPAPIGVPGKLYLGGDGLARGYLNRPDLTAERFVVDPLADEPGARMYDTGDLARYLPDGTVDYLGRNDFQVKIRGFRIELGEVEAALAQHPQVKECVVVARKDMAGEQRLAAYVVTHETGGTAFPPEPSAQAPSGALGGLEHSRTLRPQSRTETPSARSLRKSLKTRLPDYMLPATITFLDSLPLTPNGKLDRQALPAPDAAAHAPDGYEVPVGEIETTLARIWAEALRLGRVGRHDNFFELGGHSLLAVVVIERMRREGLHADVRAIFMTPTLAELAAAVSGDNGLVEIPPNRIPYACNAITPEMLPLVDLTPDHIERIVSSAPGGAANVQDIYPLAPLQEGVLFHYLLQTEGDVYLMSTILEFNTRARLDSFLHALRAVIERHDVLRTAILWEGLPEPVQVVWRQAPLVVEEISLDPAAGDITEQLRARFDARRYRIDVRQAPLLRVFTAYDAPNARWVGLLLNHHLSSDHTTLEVLRAEIQAHMQGQESQLPAPLPFRNFVAQARLGVSREEHEAFFREMLGDVDEPTAPFGLADVHGAGSDMAESWRGVDVELARLLRERSRRLGVSPASVCHLAWAQVLARVSGREDVVFGTVLFGRMQGGEGADRLLGMFINTLPVRVRVGADSVEQSVRQIHKLLGRLQRHEHASLTLAQRCSAVVAPAPLFSALMNYRHNTHSSAAAGETPQVWEGIEPLGREERTNYPVNLDVDDLGEGFMLNAQAQSPADPDRICAYMHTALERLVEALEVAPTTPIRHLDVLPAWERRQILVEWNATQAEYPRDKCIHELFEGQAARRPEAVAVVDADRQLTYGALNAEANRLAHYLRGLGLQPEGRVAILLDRSMELVACELAVLKCGAAYAPLDQNAPGRRQAFMIEDCQANLVLTVKEMEPPSGAGAPRVDIDDLKLEDQSADNVGIALDSETAAYVMYTSGSSGEPKGVVVPHRAVGRLALNGGYAEFESSDRVAFAANPAFDATTMEVWAPLLHGGCLVVIPQEVMLEPKALACLLSEEQVSILHLVAGLLSAYTEPLAAVFKRLRYLLTGGDVVDPRAVARVLRHSPPQRLIHCYGPSESTTFATTDEVSEVVEGATSLSIGRPIGNTKVYALDRHGEPAPVGVAGEIYIGGAGVATGYLNRPELTAERFVADPFAGEANARMYRSGDLGRYLPDGRIEFLGRNDFQVKIRGFRIELGEVEARLGQYPGVREAVVTARENGTGDQRLVAYYTMERADTTEGAVPAEALRAHMSLALPEYMAPAAYVMLDAMPLTLNGKIDRQALPAPEGAVYAARGYEPPVGKFETALAQIWAELLNLERVGRYDHFFNLGGHSLLAARVVSRLRQALGVEVSITNLFAHPALKDFAEVIKGAARSELAPITITSRDEPLALSFAQQRLWFLAQMEGVSQAYHIALGLRVSGPLDREALLRALDRLVARHEALRTTFTQVDGRPFQRVAAAESGFALQEHDLRRHPDAAGELERLMAEEAVAPFDLEAGPLIRGRLIQLSGAEHALLVTMHHIISDGWSMGVLTRELSSLYRAYSEGQADPLPALEIQYADYAAWQRRWIDEDALRAQAEYWRRALAGAPALLALPTDRPRPPQQDHAGAFIELELDEALTQGLKTLGQRHGTTLFMTLLAAWATLLSRLAGQEEVVIGAPVANRARAEVEPLIGFFVNTLALRLDLSKSPTVSELLRRVKAQTLGAQEHQDIPFEQVVEIAGPPRSLAHGPLVQVMFGWQNSEAGAFEAPGLTLAPVGLPYVSAKHDLSLYLNEAGARIVGGLEYATALFDGSTIERHCGYLRNALLAMVADDEQAIDRLPLLSRLERQQTLVEWNATQAEYPQDQCIHELFEAQAGLRPDAIAVVQKDDQLSYGELNARANRLARRLRVLGVEPDARVGLCVERSLDMMIGLLGILKAGAAYVPLDPTYPPERLSYMLSDSRPVVTLTHQETSSAVEAALRVELGGQGESVPLIDLKADARDWVEHSDGNLDRVSVGLTHEHLAYVIYTSGSTGKPKGAPVGHRNLANLVHWHSDAFELRNGERSSCLAGLGFDAAAWEIWPPLCVGATLLLPSSKDGRNTEDLLTWWENEVLDVSFLPTPMAELAFARGVTNPYLRTLLVGGDRLRYQPDRPASFSLINNYGPTEITVVATSGRIETSETSLHIGRPISNTRIYIVGAGLEPAPVGVAGEIYIGGAGVARGYLNRPDLTAERFVADPFTDEANARMYKSGDVGRYLPDGRIEFLGRNDFQVKIRGFRIELGEIEARLAGHPSVNEAVVVAREESAGDKRLVAYYTVAQGEREFTVGAVTSHAPNTVTAEELRAHLTALLPEYMAPAAYVMLEAMPLTPNGKLDREALPAPEGIAYAARRYEAPVGEVETKLAQIWAEALKLERVGRHDNFFELGGHSLLAVVVMERMRQKELHVDVRAFFTAPRLAALASAVDYGAGVVAVPPNLIPYLCEAITPEMIPLAQLSAADVERIVSAVPGGAANVQDIYPLAPLQEGILFHHLIATERDVYLSPTLFSFDSRARLDKFVAALQAVIARHDILRTAIQWEGLPEPLQVVWRQAPLTVEEITLDPAAGNVGEQLRERFDTRRYKLDLRQAPLLRARAAQDPFDGRWELLLLSHHMAIDHTTRDALQQEVQAHLQGRAAELPAPLPFRNFVAQARLGASREEHEAFFREMLRDVDEPTAPFGLTDVQGDGSGIRTAWLEIDGPMTMRLRETARVQGGSAASLFHLAWAQVLARVSGRADVVFGTVLFGRMQGGAGADRALGMFINTLPVRIRVGADSVLDGLRQTHELLSKLLRHEHASLALAQRCSAVPAPAPLFSSLLNYRHTADMAEAPIESARAWEGIEVRSTKDLTNYPLTLNVDDLGGWFSLNAQAQSPIDPERVCAFMHTALAQLVDALERAPATPVCGLNALPESERRLLWEWNATQAVYPQEQLIHELFEAEAALRPDAVATAHEDRQLTYGELNLRANQLARHLRKLGVKPDARVALCVTRSLDMMVGLLAIMKAGGVYVPLDPAHPAERLAYVLKDSAPVAALTHAQAPEQAVAVLTGSTERLPVIDLQRDAGVWQCEPNTNIDRASMGLSPDDLAYVIYTSGSTGKPKGVMVRHQGVINLLLSMRDMTGVGPADCVLALTTLAFDIAGLELYLPLICGARIALVDTASSHDPEALARTITASGATMAQATPATWRMLLEAGWKGAPGLKALCGGEALPVELAGRIRKRVGKLWNVYGPTETTIWSSAAPVDATAATKTTAHESIGRPIANTRIYLLDAYEQMAPIGAPGELIIGGAGVGRGYLNQPELTAERFVADPFADEPGARMYKTGDLARHLADGNIEFLGRNDFQVKVRGFRIELGEIEARLAEHPAVQEAVVMAREDSPGDQRLVAYVTPRFSRSDDGKTHLVDEQVAEWSNLWEETYTRAFVESETGFDLAGWNSSYTRLAFPPHEMRDWLDGAVARISALRPGRALEIGCGTGMILFNIAPQCERYVGVDLSRKAIDRLDEQIASRTDLKDNTQLIHGQAADFTRIPDDDYDTVILNSVVQYFPSVEYLSQVIAGAIKSIRTRGHIFIGDVRHYGLLEAFHLSVQLYQCDADMSPPELGARVSQRVGAEAELLIDPAWFYALQARFPEITHVEAMPKEGEYENEMSAYRYDVVLCVRAEAPAATDIEWIECKGAGLGWEEIQGRIVQAKQSVIGLRAIPNPRVQKDVIALKRLQDVTSSGNVAALRAEAASEGQAGMSCSELASFCASHGYALRLSWFPNEGHGEYQALITKNGPAASFDWRRFSVQGKVERNLSSYANDPVRAKWMAALPERLRKFLSGLLPEYMTPSAYVMLDALPLTPNGKLDRKALAAPAGPAYAARSYEAPVGDVETALARIWARVLKLERVGRHDDFFALGGHSLLVMKVASLLKQVDIDMTVVDLFKHPTIESLAACLEHGRHEATVKGAVAVRTTGAEKPLFLIHENTGQDLWFSLLAAQINSEIPVYGLQAVPLDELQLQTVEGMASRLARIMRTVQPVGPYRFAGWSLGGVLAYEVAIQLIGQDQAVEFVGLLDAGCPNSPPRTDPSRRREASPQAHLLALCEGLEREVPLTAGQQAILSELKCSAGESDFEGLFRQCRESGVLHPSFVDHTAQEVRRYIGRLMAHWHAIENYVAQPISIPIYLFAAEEPLAAVSGEPAPPDPLMGWGSVAPERQIHVVRVPGNHLTLMDDSHITALGRALSDAIAQAGKPRPNPPETEYRSVVSLNTGKRGNTPVFCVPGAGGNVIGFIELSVALGQEWPLYGLQPRGVEGALAPHSTVEAAATMCRREIEAVQPSGEIHLLGHSFGGWVAFEIATQMRAAGRAVSSLTIIDSEAPDGDGLRIREYTSLEVLMELIEVMELAAEKKLGIQSAELESEDETGRLRLLHEGLLRVGLLPARSAPDALRGAVRAFGAALRTSYRPRQPYTAPLRLALARDPRHDDQTNEREHHNILVGWRKWAPDIECWHGPGNHFTLLKAPHAQVLAEWWRGGLRLITK